MHSLWPAGDSEGHGEGKGTPDDGAMQYNGGKEKAETGSKGIGGGGRAEFYSIWGGIGASGSFQIFGTANLL